MSAMWAESGKPIPYPDAYTVTFKEAGRRIGCGYAHVRQLVHDGHLRTVPHLSPHRPRIALVEIERFVNEGVNA